MYDCDAPPYPPLLPEKVARIAECTRRWWPSARVGAFADVPPDEIDREVAAAIAAVRAERRQARAATS